MENPFESILQKLKRIEQLLKNGVAQSSEASSISEVLNLVQAAEYISLSKSALYKKTSEKNIPHFKQGKKIYFKKSELDEWLTQHRIKTHDEIDKGATDYVLKNKRRRT